MRLAFVVGGGEVVGVFWLSVLLWGQLDTYRALSALALLVL